MRTSLSAISTISSNLPNALLNFSILISFAKTLEVFSKNKRKIGGLRRKTTLAHWLFERDSYSAITSVVHWNDSNTAWTVSLRNYRWNAKIEKNSLISYLNHRVLWIEKPNLPQVLCASTESIWVIPACIVCVRLPYFETILVAAWTTNLRALGSDHFSIDLEILDGSMYVFP